MYKIAEFTIATCKRFQPNKSAAVEEIKGFIVVTFLSLCPRSKSQVHRYHTIYIFEIPCNCQNNDQGSCRKMKGRDIFFLMQNKLRFFT